MSLEFPTGRPRPKETIFYDALRSVLRRQLASGAADSRTSRYGDRYRPISFLPKPSSTTTDSFRPFLRFPPPNNDRDCQVDAPLSKERGPHPRSVLSILLPRTATTNKNQTVLRYVCHSHLEKNKKLRNESVFPQH